MFEPLRVLIVEDDSLISTALCEIVEDTLPADVVIKSCVRDARGVIDEPFDLALLDIDVTNGRTYEIARALGQKNVPYAIITSALKEHVPADLVDVPFIGKPFRDDQIIATVVAADVRRKLASQRPEPADLPSVVPLPKRRQEESQWTRNT